MKVLQNIDDLASLILTLGIIGILIWAAWELKKLLGPEGPDGGSGSGWSNPENPYFGLNSKNIAGWFSYFWPTSQEDQDAEDDREYTPDQQQQMSDLIDGYQIPNATQVQQEIPQVEQNVSDFWNQIESDPGSLPVF